jgi:hypothetical protein
MGSSNMKETWLALETIKVFPVMCNLGNTTIKGFLATLPTDTREGGRRKV